ncbi:hypothetical protein MRBLMN1_002198 [Chitinophaga ginsengisegetis]|uniref:hypothetical protein n=1 Tax=Chitinophaga ginsengisegetis TaxID=393003 RepID=UPI000DBA0188|nr:hypothetical protein [Chitinophaga ginsengisegetis]MDR6571084.1 hypothetical protein [Chitinophaga ginsengisegetis]MDR6650818.1 hypothetical protein [Chitinophaga ginsengisegetis]MDR6657162.1 hypothetical protein [Chitinophaga ginsengisegetis]
MRKAIFLSFLPLLFLLQSYATSTSGRNDEISGTHCTVPGKSINSAANNKILTEFNVRITLVDIYGAPVTGGTGLRGYWAKNVATGVYYYPGGQEDEDKFNNLPAGTYTFGAYPGNWEGAVSSTVTLSSDAVGPDGYIVVTLTYWVE